MKKLLNTLYITTPGAYLSLKGETVCVKIEKQTKLRLPLHTIQGIVCLGATACSPSLLGKCSKLQIGISFLSLYGKFLARVHGPVYGNVLLRREHYRRADDLVESAKIAQSVVAAKIANCRKVLQRTAREQEDLSDALQKSIYNLGQSLMTLQDPQSLDTVRGIEGDSARLYFSVFDHLIIQQKNDFSFQGRNRRPPLDAVNALLSFIYTLLTHDVISALESVGLDPYVGFLHRDRPGRPSLALDLMEEFRPILADRLALSLINRKQVSKKGFIKTESGAVKMDDTTRKTVLTSYQKRKMEEIIHPFINEKIEFGLVPFVQAQLLSRYIRGDISDYPPFIWR